MQLLILFVILKFDGTFERIITLNEIINEMRAEGALNINLTLFNTIKPYITDIREPYAFVNIIGNIVPFIPLGGLAFFLTNKKNILTLSFCLIIIFIIEMMQFYCRIGFFDVDDIFLNMIGALIGNVIVFILYRYKKIELLYHMCYNVSNLF